jgi:mono/diheme cytochrome c family protein
MKTTLKVLGGALAVAVVLGIVGIAYVISTGLSARGEPGRLETRVARAVRSMAVPREVRERANPVASTPEAVADGLAHFADHCASCHANDGSGNTEMGRGLFPKAPDMRAPVTQALTDGELFYIIEEGVRFTGMPAWGDGSEQSADATWRLVHFIRHLPKLTPAELERMETFNPKPPAEIRQQIEEERFLAGENEQTAEPAAVPHRHPGGKHD